MKRLPIKQFLLRLAILLPTFVVLCWLVSPWYVWFIGNITAALYNFLATEAITGVSVAIPDNAVLNSSVRLIYDTEEGVFPMDAGTLIGNFAPYLALVLATPGVWPLRWYRALWRGAAILIMLHIAMIFVLFAARDSIEETLELTSGVSVFVLTLPFGLWIWLVCWESLWAPPQEPEPEKQQDLNA